MHLQHLPYQLGNTVDNRVSLGLIILQSDICLEYEIRQILNTDVAIHIARIPNSTQVTPETLLEMKKLLSHTAGLLPNSVPFAAIGYGCTSASALIGEQAVSQEIQSQFKQDNLRIINPMSAVINALNHLQAKNIAVLTPYTEIVSKGIFQSLEKADFNIVNCATFNEPNDLNVANIDSPSVIQACHWLKDNAQQPPQAIFISCTNVHAVHFIDDLEQQLGIPVISSNLAFIWDLVRESNPTELIANPVGKLMQ